MYVRLAFSVAAHLEPDILLIDEVLAVGDMAFQRKCLEKVRSMRDLSKGIMLVTHNMIPVNAICSRVIFLERGRIAAIGTPSDIVPLYEKRLMETSEDAAPASEEEEGFGPISVRSVQLFDQNGENRETFETGDPMRVVIHYEANQRIEGAIVYAAIRRMDGFICVGTSTKLENITVPPLDGPGVIEIEIPEILVTPGYYVMDVTFYDQNFEHLIYFFGRRKTEFVVRSMDSSLDSKYGVVYQKQVWKIDGASSH